MMVVLSTINVDYGHGWRNVHCSCLLVILVEFTAGYRQEGQGGGKPETGNTQFVNLRAHLRGGSQMRATCVHRGGGGQKRAKNCVRTYSMPPKTNPSSFSFSPKNELVH